ncbi:MAG: sugar phosphate isomerase/epimerase family protein [Acidobacteriota bacterium]
MSDLLDRLSFNQMTASPWSLAEAVHQCHINNVRHIAPWRHKLSDNIAADAQLIRNAGLTVSSLCRGGFFSAPTPEARRDRIADNRLAIDQAHALNTRVLCLVCGPAEGQSLPDARATVLDALHELLPYAQQANVTLAIEPLHPMYCADRSVINTLQQANDMLDALAHPNAGVVVDVFHVWWDPEVFTQITRSAHRIAGFHVSDWPVPLPAILNGRDVMGNGVINIRALRQAVDATGYTGPIEIEIFNDALWASADATLIPLLQQRFQAHV